MLDFCGKKVCGGPEPARQYQHNQVSARGLIGLIATCVVKGARSSGQLVLQLQAKPQLS